MQNIDIMAATRSSINVISLNCKGIKGNLDYVEHLLQNECDLMFVCEDWLKSCDLYQMNSHFREQSYWCNLKSSVPADEVLAGQPGVGFVCRKREHCTIKNVPHDDNRISVIQKINNKIVLVTIVGVYLPFYCNSSIIEFSETLDKIHAVMESINSPVVLVGDMNAQLPQNSNLPVNWHKQRPFNRHSVLLYDFISDHNLISANFKFKQNANYTYFNSSARSYIDHMFVSENSHDKLVACTIIPFCEANLSDHLAMKLTMDLVIATPHMLKNNCNTLRSCIPKIDLSKTVNRNKYQKHLKRISRSNSMSDIDIYSCTDTSTCEHAQ